MTFRLREIPLRLGEEEYQLAEKVALLLNIPVTDIVDWKIVRKGIDARRKPDVLRVYTVDFTVINPVSLLPMQKENHCLTVVEKTATADVRLLAKNLQVVVVGMGPAGLFAALRLAESGVSVTLVERGKPVAARLQDVRNFWQQKIFDAESNIQFGEGGAGAFSDGKLTSRLNHPLTRQVLERLVAFGAPEEILRQAKPHIGSDRLRVVLINFRRQLLSLGVDIRYSTRLTGLEVSRGQLCGCRLNDQEFVESEQLVLAVGHSARDTYSMLYDAGVKIESKPFAIGVRVEHPLELINSIQYGMKSHPQLPAAEYRLAWNNQQSGRGVYSFCMCPGGMVVNAASEAGGIVVNGMSNFRRDGNYSNSALVVSVRPEDFDGDDPLAGVRFQRHWEQAAFLAGGGDWSVPAQPLLEFLQGHGGQLSSTCLPGVAPADLADCLPGFVVAELRQALPIFNRRMRGFVGSEAILTGVETRTSAPLRILRNAQHESVSHPGLYPAGEGAGYAGGIMSAAIDGLKVAESLLRDHKT
ncbi:MAG: NAD(P)/FAD-dependent oxidoreductase [Chloroflexi bacterium]|nr:NAD(P)/FAD-dependent oxidoreductase [Chloroflexota bacterium]